MSISLGSDNHSGVHPKILNSILETNQGHAPAYGTDELTAQTEKLVKEVFGKNAEPYFVFNGTAANVLCLQSMMESHEAVITASTAHLQMDECGAPEKIIGCKRLLVPSADGKITTDGIKKHLVRLGDQHCSQPKVVSITQPTEYGTCYSLEELREIRRFTRENNLLLHIDGARLIQAAHFLKTDLKSITEGIGADAVSFGGTKNGLLCGEIALIYHEPAKKKFKYIRKQNMQLPSKMRFIAGQFQELLKGPGLWREIAGHTQALAQRLAEGLKNFPEVTVTQPVQANSVFVTIPKAWFKPLREEFFFYVWDETRFEMRWMISFDVTTKDIDRFLAVMRQLKETT